jgi:hypothetical protein
MWPLSTVTEPKRERSPSASAESSVPQPHSGAIIQSGMWEKMTMGVEADLPLRSSSNHRPNHAGSGPQHAFQSLPAVKPALVIV